MATYQLHDSFCEGMFDLVIHVYSTVGPDLHDEGDLDDAGFCIKDGNYGLCLDPGEHGSLRDRALEVLHALEVVADPDNFRFMVSTAKPQMDGEISSHLGFWSVVSPHPKTHSRLAA